ncbi:retrovirus-related pol polyprotein from transposon TNT 1-94 [Tanacetum coccineum]
MSTFKTYQQSLADAGSETRPPMLEKGSYIPSLSNDAEMELMNLILLSIPNDINNSVDACTLAKDMWKRVESCNRMVEILLPSCLAKRLTVDTFDDLFDYLQQFEKLVNVSRAKKLEKSHNHLALMSTNRIDVYTNSGRSIAYAMLLLALAHYSKFSTPTNNRLHTSSNTINQAIIQGDRVNIQSRNSGNAGRNNRRAYVQEEIIEGSNAPNETGNVQRTLRTSSSGNTLTVQCYNCSGKGHYARNCPKPRVSDASRMEEIEELSANICLMARIQPVDNTYNAGPSYDSAFISEVQSSSNNENEEQMNVNSGSIEKDTHVPDLYIIRDLEKQRDKLDLDVKGYKWKNEELQKTHSILKRQMSENEDRYHDTVLDLEAKLKNNVDLILKLGNSLQGMFMLGPKLLSVYDSLGNSKISLNVRDTEDTLDDASKSQQKVYEKMNDPITVANKQNCWTIDYAQINALYKDFVPQKELST